MWNEAGMAGYQAQTSSVISDIMENFTQAAHIPALTEMCSKPLVLSAQLNFDSSIKFMLVHAWTLWRMPSLVSGLVR